MSSKLKLFWDKNDQIARFPDYTRNLQMESRVLVELKNVLSTTTNTIWLVQLIEALTCSSGILIVCYYTTNMSPQL